ncbi:MAG: phosphotransferase [Candidatus Cloacimonetes bacterium]|nr:phosphotransferase [Candidatus Cloacimonadota bacterium]
MFIKDHHLIAIASSRNIETGSLHYLGGGRAESDGITYSFHKNDQKMVLKILKTSDNNDDLLRSEDRMKFAQYLHHNGVKIICPIQEESLQIHYLDDMKLFSYIMPFQRGKPIFNRLWDARIYEKLGIFLGRMHCLAKQYTCRNEHLFGWQKEWKFLASLCEDNEILQKWHEIKSTLKSKSRNRENFGFIHNDAHFQNFLVYQDELFLLDFDVSNYHWFAADIGIVFASMMQKTGGFINPVREFKMLENFTEKFWYGYHSTNPDSPELQQSEIDFFINYRRVLIYIILKEYWQEKPESGEKMRKKIINLNIKKEEVK